MHRPLTTAARRLPRPFPRRGKRGTTTTTTTTTSRRHLSLTADSGSGGGDFAVPPSKPRPPAAATPDPVRLQAQMLRTEQELVGVAKRHWEQQAEHRNIVRSHRRAQSERSPQQQQSGRDSNSSNRRIYKRIRHHQAAAHRQRRERHERGGLGIIRGAVVNVIDGGIFSVEGTSASI